MKKYKIYWILVVLGLLSGVVFAHQLTLSKVGEWGTGAYNKVYVKGNYAYCAAGYAGLDIINIANPANPQKVGNYETPGYTFDVTVKGNYAYAADGQIGLQVIDISSPSSPQLIGTCDTPGSCAGLYVYGNYAYVADGDSGLQIINISTPATMNVVGNFPIAHRTNGVFVVGNYAYVIMGEWDSEIDETFGGLIILDILNPALPQQVGSLNLPCATGIYVLGNYAFLSITAGEISSGGGLAIIDVTNPSSPVKVKLLNELYTSYTDIDIKGNYAYCVGGQNLGVTIIDIGNPTNPTFRGSIEIPGWGYGVHTVGNYAYVASGSNGLRVFNVSDRTNPVLAGTYDNSGIMEHLRVSGNYAYTGENDNGGLQVIDISTPASPTLVGNYNDPDTNMRGLFVKGKYAYAGYSGHELRVIDITDPTAPVLSGTYKHSRRWYPTGIDVSGNNAYVSDYESGLTIINVSTPSNPTLVKQYDISRGSRDIYVKGNYAYMSFFENGLKIIDISTPTSPGMVGSVDLPKGSNAVFISGNYAYVASADYGTASPPVITSGKLYIINVANPASPSLVGSIDLPEIVSEVFVSGNYAYVTCGLSGLKMIDISNPASPTLAAGCDTSGPAQKVDVKDNYIYVANGENGKLLVLQREMLPNPPRIHLNRTALFFAATNSGAQTVAIPQTFFISNTGEGALEWSVSVDQEWLFNCSPTGGANSGEVTVSVYAAGLSAGTYNGTITVSDPAADNSPQEITVTLKIYDNGQTSVPFGQFETPTDNSTVSGSIPVTGWVLDDIGVRKVQIFRDSQDSLVYIGDAVFVEGARPDVEQTYPGYPMNYKAGWGYMLLTHYLPGGSGTFTFYAYAADVEGCYVLLGRKTITVDNAHAVKPFGTLDTPTQGGVVSGRNSPNFGWVLTPKPNTVPTDGSTIHVWVDGLQLGSPVYNQYREDIPSLFPGYNNSGGAVGYFNLDTTRFANGVHTICWTAADDAGNSEGIGSRYFSIQNTGVGVGEKGSAEAQKSGRAEKYEPGRGEPLCSPVVDRYGPVSVNKGYKKDEAPQQVFPDGNGTIRVVIKELERVVIRLNDEQAVEMEGAEYTGYLSVGNRLKPLPVGSTMDVERGIFYWQPGPGFVGRYLLVFIKRDSRGMVIRKNIVADIIPKFS